MIDVTDRRLLIESGRFDEEWYCLRYPDVRLSGMDPLEHYLWIGRRLNRQGASIRNRERHTEESETHKIENKIPECGGDLSIGGTDSSRAIAVDRRGGHGLMLATDKLPLNEEYPVTRFMYYVWLSRPDLQTAFPLQDHETRVAFCEWFVKHGSKEYAVPGWAFPHALLKKFSVVDGEIGEIATDMLSQCKQEMLDTETKLTIVDPGVNLVGYARGEFGMGEQVRAAADSFYAVTEEFTVVNVPETGIHGESESRIDHWISKQQRHPINIFHVNADVLPSLYFRLGPGFFQRFYNIGHWAWELAKCPEEFEIALGMVDEVWAISEFAAGAYRARTDVPVFNMPQSVELPKVTRCYTKHEFSLDDDEFVILFTFDAASYLDRKNPLSLIRAFKRAFPRRSERVRLLLKTMNARPEDAKWQSVVTEATEDRRITILSDRLRRDEVLGLYSVCDAFASLHRSEGFGRCMAEAMLFDKPVIATGYSGSSEFVSNETAFVVDYKLVPVEEGAYPFWNGQVWAEPDLDHAAWQMRRIWNDEPTRRQVAAAGRRFIQDNFSPAVIGARYTERLASIRKTIIVDVPGAPARSSNSSSSNHDRKSEPNMVRREPVPDDAAIHGCVDYPEEGKVSEIFGGAVRIVGWVTGGAPIRAVKVRCDDGEEQRAHHGILRPDIANAYPTCIDSGRSGFGLSLDVSELCAGDHRLRISAEAENGASIEWGRTIRVKHAAVLYEEWSQRQTKSTNQHTITLILKNNGQDNSRELLRDTLTSIQTEDLQNIEVVVCGAGDTANIGIDLAANMSGSGRPIIRHGGASLTEAINCAKGEFISILHFGDQLTREAIRAVTANLMSRPDTDLIYGDEEIRSGTPKPQFKPGWSPLYLREINYIGRPFFLRKALAARSLRENPEWDGNEHALLTSTSQYLNSVIHVPAIMAQTVATHTPANRERKRTAEGENVSWPSVSIIIPTCLGSRAVVESCFDGLLNKTDYPKLDVLIVANNLRDRDEGLGWLRNWPFEVLEWSGGFNWSALNNAGARHTSGEMLLFLNDDVVPLERGWLKEMVEVAKEPRVGAVGALLTYPGGLIQHAGMNLGRAPGQMHHTFRLYDVTNREIAKFVSITREQSAVTGACLMVRRQHYESIEGFDESYPVICNDVDFCFRLEAAGFTNVLAGRARLTHYEGISRGGRSELEDATRFRKYWGFRFGSADPYMNPNLDHERGDWSVDVGSRESWVGRWYENRKCPRAMPDE